MGNNKYDIEFRNECGRVLEELYNNPIDMGDTGLKRITIKTEKRYIDYLSELELIKDLKTTAAGKYGIQLERKGFEVFEKYKGWNDYLVKVIDQDLKIDKARKLAVQYWWLPICISLLSLIIALFSLLKK